jgi:hypothetical protein
MPAVRFEHVELVRFPMEYGTVVVHENATGYSPIYILMRSNAQDGTMKQPVCEVRLIKYMGSGMLRSSCSVQGQH